MGTSELFLTRVMYKENVSDWFALVAISVGAPCRDFGSPQIFYQGNGLADHSCFGPSLLDEYNRSAIGLTVRKSNVVAFLGQFIDMRRNLTSNVLGKTFITFGQTVCHLPRDTKFSVMVLHRVHDPSTLSVSPGTLSFSSGHQNHVQDHSSFEEYPDPYTGSYRKRIVSEASIMLMLESSLDGNTTFGGWVGMNNSNTETHTMVGEPVQRLQRRARLGLESQRDKRKSEYGEPLPS